MSSPEERDEYYGNLKSIHRPVRPTGLRSRNTTPQSYPDVHESTVTSLPARLNSSTFKTRTRNQIPPTIQPLFVDPVPSDGVTGKRNWSSAASRRLLFEKLREKASFTHGQATMASPTPTQSQNSSSRKLVIYPSLLTGSSPSPTPIRGPNYPYHPSPPDKPLPSLPVATTESKSPVRRSLIDCAERPLRRSSASPEGDGGVKEEDWPSMHPSKPEVATTAGQTGSFVKTSLGESLINGMQGLRLEDKRDECVRPEPKIHFETSEAALARKVSGIIDKPPASLYVSDKISHRPLSSSQLPKPRSSMLESLARHVDSPPVRQTKTSAMRLRRSIGIKTWGSNEKKQETDSHPLSIRERAPSSSVPGPRQTSPGGAVRSTSRGRHGVTARGSPYTIPSRMGSRSSNTSRNTDPEIPSGRNTLAIPSNLRDSSEGHNDKLLQQPATARRSSRQSSIPLPRRASRPASNIDSQDVPSETRVDEFNNGTKSTKPNVVRADKANDTTNTSEDHPDACVELLNVKEVLCSPAPHDNESVSSSDVSAGTTYGYDSFGGFRVKRVRNASQGGPTLRITDSASQILLGDEKDNSGVENQHADGGSKYKASDSRRTSAILARPLSFARSFADRSLSHLKMSDDIETAPLLIEASNSESRTQAAKLPEADVEPGYQSFVESHTSLDAAGSVPKEAPEQRCTPTSTHGDWPCKDFANLKLCSESAPAKSDQTRSEQPASPTSSLPGPPSRLSSRPSAIIQRAVPSKEISPFLFQDLEYEQGRKDKRLDQLPNFVNGPDAKTVFPPRISSRKPKPPPIVISPPEHLPSVRFFPAQAMKPYEVRPETIRKPKNVRTFSQSKSPRTDSSKGSKPAHKSAYNPTSNSKKVMSNIRGIFHKRSTESALQGNGSGGGLEGHDAVGHKLVAETEMKETLSSESAAESAEPDTSFQPPTIRNPFVSPTTPFTATIMPLASPTSASPPTPITRSLSNATKLTHSLLDLARAETDTQRKTYLIELSKCMVEVVSAARDAEKAMEKAKMEAARAELCWLKVQKEVETLDSVVKGVVHGNGEGEK